MIKISNLQKRFDDLEVLRDVNIDVAEGEVQFNQIIKSTMLLLLKANITNTRKRVYGICYCFFLMLMKLIYVL